MSWLGGWEGYRVERIERRDGETPEIWLHLGCQPGGGMICDGCGGQVESVHDVEMRAVRDLPILEARTRLSVPRRRVACPRCGPKLERLTWLDRHARVTRRLADSVVRLCAVLPIKQVAAFFGLHWDTVKGLDKAALARRLDPLDLTDVEFLAMDEFAIQRGHRYATVVIEPQTRRVLWVGRDRSREAVRPFFERLGEDGCRRIKAVAMDMSAAYANELRAHRPQAEIVYDLFHVVARYGHDVAAWQRWNAKALASGIPPLIRLRPQPCRICPRHHRQRNMAPQHQRPRRHQQPNQGHQARGLRFP